MTTLPGLRSRWTIPCSCAASSASATARAMTRARTSGSGPSSRCSAKDLPGTSSSTRKSTSPSESKSNSVAMPGWSNRESARLETEAPSRRLVAQGLVADDLEGHLSLEARVLGPVHDPHPALAEALDDPVSTECCVHGVPGGTMAQHPIRKTKP